MKYFKHRINTTQALLDCDQQYGVEIDIRSNGKSLYLHHDAFEEGELFLDWVKSYQHHGMILNTKCEGMEEALLDLMEQQGIEDYFFLDLSLPYMVKYLNKGVNKIAVRYSKYEPFDFAMQFAGKAQWIWVDCFHASPMPKEEVMRLSDYFQLCLVSPELQGGDLSFIPKFQEHYEGIPIAAICTKFPELWK